MPPHRPDAYARWRARKLERERTQAKVNKALLCEVPACANRRAWRFRYCEHHRQRIKRWGHPEGRALYDRDLEPFLTEVKRLYKTTRKSWPDWRAAADTLEAILADPSRTHLIGLRQDYLWRALASRHRKFKKATKGNRQARLRNVLCRLVAVWALRHFGYKEAPPNDLAMDRQLGAQVLSHLRPDHSRREGHEGQSRALMGRIVRIYLGNFLAAIVADLERRHRERQRASLRQADAKAPREPLAASSTTQT